MAGMVSLAFRENDPRTIVREAARLIHPSSPYRQCLNLVISMAEQGRPVQEIFQAVEDRWHLEYPPMNNAVANGGLVAASVWYGEGDYLKTLNLAYHAADYSDADCNAATAGAVIGAMRGRKALPPELVASLNDRITGSRMGPVKFRTVVDERISDIIRRIAAVGRKVLAANGARVDDTDIRVAARPVATQPVERFQLSEYAMLWDPAWTLERAGFGFGGGRCPRGTWVEDDVLATWPRDESRGVVLRRQMKIEGPRRLELEVAADGGCGWQLELLVNNNHVLRRVIDGGSERGAKQWQKIEADLSAFSGQEVDIRLYQRTLLQELYGGAAYWRGIRVN
jgi:hypothetical protein